MNITLQIPLRWLRELHPQFELMKSSDSTMRRMVVELLGACCNRYGASALEPAADAGGEDGVARVMAYVPESTARTIVLAARASSLSPGLTAKAMLYKLWTQKPEQPAVNAQGNVLGDVLVAMQAAGSNAEVRMEQLTAFNCMSEAMTGGRIGMIEASTGVGKSLAMLMAGIEWTENNDSRTCVAVPTLALVRQCVAEYHKIGSVRSVPPLAVLFGKREFVSAQALGDLLAEQPQLQEKFPGALAWLDMHGVGQPGLEHYQESPWLAENLRQVAPEFPVEEVILGEFTQASDPGLQAYRKQFVVSGSTRQVVLCTHAMLAYDMRLRLRSVLKDENYQAINEQIQEVFKALKTVKDLKEHFLNRGSGEDKIEGLDEEKSEHLTRLRQFQGELVQSFSEAENVSGLLPRYRGLIVDEAHMLETSFSGAFSDYLALRKMLRTLAEYKHYGGAISAMDLEKARAMVNLLSAKTPGKDLKLLSSTQMAFARAALDELLVVLQPCMTARVTKKTPVERVKALTELRRGSALIKLALKQGAGRAYLRLSPQRAYPQLYVGRDTLDSVLKLLWGSIDAGLAVSATLYLRRQDGPSANYMANLLQIPDARRAEYPPIEAPWLREAVTQVYTPTGSEAAGLRPPSMLDRLTDLERASRTHKWLDHLALKLRDIHQGAAGGVLVLNTSYETIQELQTRLADMQPCTVLAQEGKSLQRQAQAFLQLHLAGTKPLWLAVGGAWTGLDIGGHDPMQRLLALASIPAEQDNVLTDLVIPRLPFGTNQTITHLRRKTMNSSMPWDLLDAAFRFLQGMGRLVRRKGLPHNRKIWILDGRLDEPTAKQNLSLFWAAIGRWKFGRSNANP